MNIIPTVHATYPINLILVDMDLVTPVSGEDCRLRSFSSCILRGLFKNHIFKENDGWVIKRRFFIETI